MLRTFFNINVEKESLAERLYLRLNKEGTIENKALGQEIHSDPEILQQDKTRFIFDEEDLPMVVDPNE